MPGATLPRRPQFAALVGGPLAGGLDADLHTKLRLAVSDLEGSYGRVFAAPADLTAGGRFQAILRRPATAVEIVVGLEERLPPGRMAWGLGFGPLASRSRPRTVEIEGPCVRSAHRAFERAARSRAWLLASGFPPPTDEVVNALFQLMRSHRGRWTARQTEFAREARSRPQKEVARALSISPSVVSESLKAAAFRAVVQGEEALQSLLEPFDPNAPRER